MLYLTFSGKIKDGKAAEFYEKIAVESQKLTLERDKPVVYQWYKNQSDPHLFFLHEQWHSIEHLHAHFATLRSVYGPANATEELPAAMLDYFEETSATFYDIVN